MAPTLPDRAGKSCVDMPSSFTPCRARVPAVGTSGAVSRHGHATTMVQCSCAGGRVRREGVRGGEGWKGGGLGRSHRAYAVGRWPGRLRDEGGRHRRPHSLVGHHHLWRPIPGEAPSSVAAGPRRLSCETRGWIVSLARLGGAGREARTCSFDPEGS